MTFPERPRNYVNMKWFFHVSVNRYAFSFFLFSLSQDSSIYVYRLINVFYFIILRLFYSFMQYEYDQRKSFTMRLSKPTQLCFRFILSSKLFFSFSSLSYHCYSEITRTIMIAIERERKYLENLS